MCNCSVKCWGKCLQFACVMALVVVVFKKSKMPLKLFDPERLTLEDIRKVQVRSGFCSALVSWQYKQSTGVEYIRKFINAFRVGNALSVINMLILLGL